MQKLLINERWIGNWKEIYDFVITTHINETYPGVIEFVKRRKISCMATKASEKTKSDNDRQMELLWLSAHIFPTC